MPVNSKLAGKKRRLDALVRDGRLDEAQALCVELLDGDRSDAAVWRLYARILAAQGRTRDAINALQTVVLLQPDSADAHYQIALALQRHRSLEAAAAHYRRVLELDPRHFGARLNLGSLAHEQGRFEEAVEHFRVAADLDSGAFLVYANLGNTLVRMNRLDDAVVAYGRALAIKPEAPLVHNSLGEVLERQNRLQQALESYARALRLRSGFVEAHVNMGNALQKMGRVEDGERSYRHALALDPRNASAWHNLAVCLYNDRELGAAADAFGNAIRLDTGNALARCFYGIVLDQQGKAEQAEAHYQAAVRAYRYTASVIESFRYARERAPSARYFSNTMQLLEYAFRCAPEEGSLLELGVSFGTSINYLARLTERTIHGFDSFEGLPESWYVGADKGGNATETTGAYTTGGQLPETVDNVELHVGWFDDTLPPFAEAHAEPVAFMNVDCDIYSSTKTVFRCLGGRVQPGTVIVFDEYFCYPEWREHEYKAFQEFVAGANVSYEYLAFSLFTGQAAVRVTSIAADR